MKIDGLPVVNANKKVSLVISATDVNKGKTKDPKTCAAARACMRQMPSCTAARVHLGRTYVKVAKKWVRFGTPPALRSEIIAFDRGGSFAAGTYTLMPLAESKKPTGKRQGTVRTGKRKAATKKRVNHTVPGVRNSGPR